MDSPAIGFFVKIILYRIILFGIIFSFKCLSSEYGAAGDDERRNAPYSQRG